jgi:hypothetical protein
VPLACRRLKSTCENNTAHVEQRTYCMKFDTETFKAWVGNLGLANGWNSVTITKMREYYDSESAQGYSMPYVAEVIAKSEEFLAAIAPALIEAGPEADTVISVLVKDGLVEYVNGPQFKRMGEDIVLQVGLSKYATEINEAGSLSVGSLKGTVEIAAITKEENKKEVPVKDENGNPRFKASVELMDFSNEESTVYRIWFSFQKNLKDGNGNIVVATLAKLKIALSQGKLFKYLSVANEAGSGSSNGEDTVWVDMRMLPKGTFNITKVVGPKKKVYEDGVEKNLWFLEIEDIGMTQAHAILAADLEVMGDMYKTKAERGQLRVRITEHLVNFQHVNGQYKKVEYFPDFFQAFEKGEVTPVKKGVAGENRKHYMSMAFVTGGEYEFESILGGIVNQALKIAVRPESTNALPESTPSPKPALKSASVAVVDDEEDYIPF